MSSKKMIILLIVSIMIVVGIIWAYNAHNTQTGKKVEQKSGYTDKLTKIEEDRISNINSKYSSNIINQTYKNFTQEDRTLIDSQIDKILGYINSKNTQELYELLPRFYKNLKFRNFEDFDKYIKETFSQDVPYTVSNYRVIDRAVLYFNVVDSNNSLIKEVRMMNYTSTADDFRIAFDAYNNLELQRFMQVTQNHIIDSNYYISYEDSYAIQICIQNLGNSSETFDFTGTTMTSKNGNYSTTVELTPNSERTATLKASEIKYIELNFEKPKGLPKYINLVYTCNGEKIEKQLTIQYEFGEE